MSRHSIPGGPMWLSALLAAAPPAWAQLERDHPVPPGEPEPVTVFTRVADAGVAEDHDGADYIIVLDQSINRVMENGVTYVDLYTIYKVLTEKGAQDKAVLDWRFDPRSSFVKVAEVNIIRDGGRIPMDLAALQELAAPQSMIYWGDHIMELQLPRLKVGDGIEVIAMRKGYNYALLQDGGGDGVIPRVIGAHQAIASPGDDKYIPPMPGQYFDIVIMQASVPILEKRYTLTLPKDKYLQSEVYNGPVYTKTEYNADSTLYTWWSYDIAPNPHEPRQPGEWDVSPKVVMTTAASWEQKSDWFFDVNKNQFETTEAVKQKVQQILASNGLNMNSDPMKIATVLNHWVAQNIRYSGQTMGEGEGFTLHPSEELIEYRSGVCKDIASMSITLLRAAGLKTYPAMTMAGATIEDIPADQFNHCVVAWEKTPGDFVMLDPTWVPFNNDIWSKLEAEQQYVIGHPGGVDLQEIRYSPPSESPLNVTNTAILSDDGALSGKVRLAGGGALDSRLRRLIYGPQERALVSTFAGILGVVSDAVVVKKLSYRDDEDFTGDMWIEIEYEIPGFALPVEGGLEFSPPMVNMVKDHVYLFRAGATDWGKERTTDVFLYYTEQLNVDEDITLPKGWSFAHETSVDPVDETFASFESNSSMDGRVLKLHSRTEIRRRQFPPSGYPGFIKALDHLDDYAGGTVRVAKGGA